MINEALTFLTNTLNDHLKDNKVILASLSDGHKDKVIITLVNIAQEATLRNAPSFRPNELKQQAASLGLSLSVLISTSFNDYSDSLKCIDETILFFNSNNVFTKQAYPAIGSIEKLIIDLDEQSISDKSALCQMLGSSYIPSVQYKVRLISSS